MSVEATKLHVAMLPFLAFGHMIPYVELAKRIAQKGHRVSFICTPRNISRLPQVPSHLSDRFQFVPLPLPRHECLPEGAEATIDIPPDKAPYLTIALDGLQQAISDFLQASGPDWVLHDFCYSWVPPLSRGLGVSSACFVVVNAWAACYYGPPDWAMVDGEDPRVKPEDYATRPPWVPFDTAVRYRLFEAKKIFGDAPRPSGTSIAARVWSTMTGCDYILIKTSPELEPEWIDLFGNLTRKQVVPVGFLAPAARDDGSRGSDDDTWRAISGWLDKWDRKSVVYVAHGTEVDISRNDIMELALGLELSGLPFFWAFRKPKEADPDAEPADFLPEGFEGRVRDRGLLWKTWVPQTKILRHASVGGFVNHSGWGSVVEALSNGVPLIMLPHTMDQPLIARVFAEKKVGVEIPRDELDGSFTSDSVAEAVKLVVGDERGRIYRENAEGMRQVFGDDKRQEQYVDRLIQLLADHRASLKN